MLYNGKRISRTEWRRTAIEDSFAAMSDLQWQIEFLVIAGGDVAARLRDTGTLQNTFLGIKPSGRHTEFGENVFYLFSDDGRTSEVWSIVDLAVLAREQEA